MKLHGDLTVEKFWIDWFGPLGRVIGTKGGKTVPSQIPTRRWTDNPNDLIKHIKICVKEHEPNEFCRACFISSQPMRNTGKIRKDGTFVGEACAIEKLFFDFDDDTKYCIKCKKYIKKKDFRPIKGKKGTFCPKCGSECKEKPRLDVVGEEVKKFVKDIKHEVLIVQTRKGYHVYIFLRQIFTFPKKMFKFAKKVYRELQEIFILDGTYEFMDERILGDLNRFARVPMTAHEKTGIHCQIMDRNLKPTKIRNLDFFRTYGITDDEVKKIVEKIKNREYREYHKRQKAIEDVEEQLKENGRFQGKIRPCFQTRMDIGEMCHAQRLAWLSEIYHAGYDTKEKMLELCRKTWNDFNEKTSMQQIEDYFKHERWEWKPYKCSTLKEKGWCLESDDCPYWQGKH